MNYIDPQGNYPRHQGDIRLSNPEWSDGDPLPTGWTLVNHVDAPSFDYATEKLVENSPELNNENGQYYRSWAVVPLTAEELEILNAPVSARQKLINLGLTEVEVDALVRGLR
jgi:hypothetical protein